MEESFEDNQYLLSRGTTFDELRNDQKYSDVVIVTSDGSKFACHKIILVAGCPFFKGLFASDMVESRQNEVNLHPIDISGPLFKQILEFIYTGIIKLNFGNAKALNVYAGLFTMKNLKSFTEIYLMKNVTKENCLELWRHSVKYLNDNLKECCLWWASTESFLDYHIYNLTMEEIKSIVSLRKVNSKILLENIVKWIKIDFEDRQQYIKDLMSLVDFDGIKDKQYEREIFSDDVLMQNKEFLTLSVKYLLKSSIASTSRTSAYAVDVPKKTLFVLTETKIFYTDFDNKEFVVTTLSSDSERFATTNLTTNGFLTTGGRKNGDAVNACTQFCPSKSVKKEFPRLVEARVAHRNYSVGSKIYACGGFRNQTVEIFEENAGKWISGPSMNTDRFSFGAADDGENSLYAVGGRKYSSTSYNSIEHLDTRMNSWNAIYTDPSLELGFTQSLYKSNKIFCFGEAKGFMFDIRTNKIVNTIPYKLDRDTDLMFPYSGFDCTIVNDDIWLIGRVTVNNKNEIPNAFKLKIKNTKWKRTTFKGLDDFYYLGLVWCKNN